jgi:hypothetical protein
MDVSSLVDTWLFTYNLTNVGGILGIGYNETLKIGSSDWGLGSSIWVNSTLDKKEFAV